MNHSEIVREKNFENPTLVQRMIVSDGIPKFNYDYMGSAEFEFGAIPHAFKLWKLWKSQNRINEAEEFKINGKVFWISGTQSGIENAKLLISDQLGEKSAYLKERTGLNGEIKNINLWLSVPDNGNCLRGDCHCNHWNNRESLIFAISLKKDYLKEYVDYILNK